MRSHALQLLVVEELLDRLMLKSVRKRAFLQFIILVVHSCVCVRACVCARALWPASSYTSLILQCKEDREDLVAAVVVVVVAVIVAAAVAVK